MSKRLNHVAKVLKDFKIPVISVEESDFPEDEDHLIRINDEVHVSVSACEEFYATVCKEIKGPSGELLFQFCETRTKVSDVVDDVINCLNFNKK